MILSILSILTIFKFLFFALTISIYRIKLFAKSFRNQKLANKVYAICVHLFWMVFILSFIMLVNLDYFAAERGRNQMEI